MTAEPLEPEHFDYHGHHHPYHLVDPSPWPIIGALCAGLMFGGGVLYMHGGPLWLIAPGFLGVLTVMALWWRDVIREGIYPTTFFMATGFHGFHVIIGTTFLTVCLFRAIAGQFKPTQHLGFEFAAWYWHFVDVVWLFLFACIYVWGAGPHPG